MANSPGPHWTAYVGMVTGMAGIVLAIWGHLRVNKLRRVDEWRVAAIELGKARAKLDTLPEQIADALKSRISVGVAAGHGSNSSSMKLFKKQTDDDIARVAELTRTTDPLSTDQLKNFSAEKLAKTRIEISSVRDEADTIWRKYERSAEQDDRQREQLLKLANSRFK